MFFSPHVSFCNRMKNYEFLCALWIDAIYTRNAVLYSSWGIFYIQNQHRHQINPKGTVFHYFSHQRRSLNIVSLLTKKFNIIETVENNNTKRSIFYFVNLEKWLGPFSSFLVFVFCAKQSSHVQDYSPKDISHVFGFRIVLMLLIYTVFPISS